MGHIVESYFWFVVNIQPDFCTTFVYHCILKGSLIWLSSIVNWALLLIWFNIKSKCPRYIKLTFSNIWGLSKNLNQEFSKCLLAKSVTRTLADNRVNFIFVITHCYVCKGRCKNCTHWHPFYLQVEFAIKC